MGKELVGTCLSVITLKIHFMICIVGSRTDSPSLFFVGLSLPPSLGPSVPPSLPPTLTLHFAIGHLVGQGVVGTRRGINLLREHAADVLGGMLASSAGGPVCVCGVPMWCVKIVCERVGRAGVKERGKGKRTEGWTQPWWPGGQETTRYAWFGWCCSGGGCSWIKGGCGRQMSCGGGVYVLVV